VAEHGWKLLPEYRFELASGLWRHRSGPVEPPLRLSQVSYDADGSLTFPRQDDVAPASARQDALAYARALFDAPPRPAQHASTPVTLDASVEHLRWFELPAECLVP